MDNIDETLQKFAKFVGYDSKLERTSRYDINAAPLQKTPVIIDNEIISGEVNHEIKKQRFKIMLFYGLILFFVYIVMKELTYDIKPKVVIDNLSSEEI